MKQSYVTFDHVEVGDPLPDLACAPISRLTLALFAGASGDHNPVHVDPDVARKAGNKDVLAHGMLLMAYTGRLLTNLVPQASILQFGVRFTSVTYVHDEITCSAKVVARFQENGHKRLRLAVTAVNQDGDVKLSGEAVVALP